MPAPDSEMQARLHRRRPRAASGTPGRPALARASCVRRRRAIVRRSRRVRAARRMPRRDRLARTAGRRRPDRSGPRPCARRGRPAARGRSCARQVPGLAAVPRSASAVGRCCSTNVACAAPRESASKPSAPVPAKRSRTFALSTRSARIENNASLTRAGVGRTARPVGVFTLRLRSVPPVSLKVPIWMD